MISKLIFTTYLAFFGVDTNVIPDRCHDMRWDQNTIHSAEKLTGYHDQKTNDYLKLLERKGNIFDCTEKLKGNNSKYQQRDELYKHLRGDLGFLAVTHCPEISNGLESINNEQTNATQLDQKLHVNLQDEYNRLQCNKFHHTHNHHHHKNITQGN